VYVDFSFASARYSSTIRGSGVRISGELLEHVLGRGGLTGRRACRRHRQLQPLEQNLLQLPRRLDVELDARLRLCACPSSSCSWVAKSRWLCATQPLAIDQHAAMLHALNSTGTSGCSQLLRYSRASAGTPSQFRRTAPRAGSSVTSASSAA
jgi:hypothetical protein